MLLVIDWSVAGIKTLQFIMSFSILVVLHELGHFIPARLFKCRVEKFYLFFNPWFSLWKKKIGETEYGLGWVPFGGYVKIAGMIDESMDKEQMKLPPKPDEFRAKKAWQRLIIMIGGVVVNVILAIVIFIGIMWAWGEEYLPAKNLKYGIVADSLGKQVGLKDGDVILKVGDAELKNVFKTAGQIIVNEAKTLTINRDGNEMQIALPDSLIRQLNKSKGEDFVGIRVPFLINSFSKDGNAEKAGLKKGDRIIAINSTSTLYFTEVKNALKNDANKNVVVKVIRNNSDTVTVTVLINKDAKLGAFPEPDLSKLGFKLETKNYNFFEAVPAGFKMCWNTLKHYITGIKQLFTGQAKASESLGSVISIGGLFPGVWDWQAFWTLTAIFSIVLAFMNILPIPALDGGHALFTIVEMITGHKPSDKFMEYAQMFGMILFLGLMTYALGLDFLRLFK
ncbi:MAG TPA: RIP metalloprotease RseP [Chitinophagaceae bacterium]|nr:RIP metalloprotease RseP [Chitinophagaceae bacterium]